MHIEEVEVRNIINKIIKYYCAGRGDTESIDTVRSKKDTHDVARVVATRGMKRAKEARREC